VKLRKVEEKVGSIIVSHATVDKEQIAQQIGVLVDYGHLAAEAPELEGIELGDTILFHRYSGMHFPIDGESYWLMKASQCCGKCTKLPDFVLGSTSTSFAEFGANVPKAA
jgi:co-chaperonin GroES (HSP10)